MKTLRGVRFFPAIAVVVALVVCGLALGAHRRSGVDFQAKLTPAQEVLRVRSKASGRIDARLWRTPSGGRIKWSLVFERLSSPALAATIHEGRAGTAGPVLIRLCGRCRRPAGGILRVSPKQANALLHAPTYVTIATSKHPAGELRGQLHRHG